MESNPAARDKCACNTNTKANADIDAGPSADNTTGANTNACAGASGRPSTSKGQVMENDSLTVTCDLETGCFGVASKDLSPAKLCGAAPAVRSGGVWRSLRGVPVKPANRREVQDARGRGVEHEFEYERLQGVPVVTATVMLPRSGSQAFFRLRLRNEGSAPMAIGKVHVLRAEREDGGMLDVGTDLAGAKVYLESNNLCWTGAKDLLSTGAGQDAARAADLAKKSGVDYLEPSLVGEAKVGLHESAGVGLVWNPNTRVCFLAAFVTADLALTKLSVAADPSKGVILWHAGCAYDELELAPGAELVTEELYLGFSDDPFKSLEDYGDLFAAQYGIQPAENTPLLWCSWYSHRLMIDEQAVLDNARVVAERFKQYGVDTVQIDFGWNYKDTPGEWTAHEERFSHGMKWISERIQEMGLKLGLWIAPFYVGSMSKLHSEHPEVLLTDPATGRAPVFTWKWGCQPEDTWQSVNLLDPRYPYAQEWLRQVFTEVRSWGVDYYKLDFLDAGSSGPLCFSKAPESSYRLRDGEMVRKGLSVIRQAAGDHAYILACNLPITHGVGVVSAVFTAMDVGNPQGNFEHLKTRNNTVISRFYQQKRLWHNDPDVISLSGTFLKRGEICSIGEARIRLTSAGLSGGPVLLGDDLPTLQDERLEMYTLCLPAYGVSARPIDLFSNDHARIWDLKVVAGWGEWHVVGLFNYEPEDATIPVPLDGLKLDRDRNYLVWEFWDQEFLGTHPGMGGLDVRVPKETARLLAIREVPAHPAVLSTSFHVCQGACELSGVAWDEAKGTLSGSISRHKGANGRIFLYVPPTLKVDGLKVNGATAALGRIDDAVQAVDLSFQGRQADWLVKFGAA